MNWKSTIFIFLFLCVLTSVYSQNLLEVNKSEYVSGTDNGSQAFKKIKIALKNFKDGEGLKNNVLPLLLEAYSINNNNAELNYNIGVCYLVYGPRNMALNYLQNAHSIKANVSGDIFFLLGVANQYCNNFDEAIMQYKLNIEFLRQNNINEKFELVALSEKRIAECKNALILFNETSNCEIELASGYINSEFDDFNPVYINNEFFFSSKRLINENLKSTENIKLFEGIYTQDSSGSVHKVITNTSSKSNIAMMSELENRHIIYLGAEGNGDIYYAKKSKNKLVKAKAIKFINDSKSRESSVCFSKGYTELYFISDRKGGFGNCDIYYCNKNEKGEWNKPVNLGGEINTEFDEADVFVTEDGSEMYFSSKGHNTIGGYDIFKCIRTESGFWGTPKNMGIPVNSTDNDITYYISPNGDFYFASERYGGKGGLDIYQEKKTTTKLVDTTIVTKMLIVEQIPNSLPKDKLISDSLHVSTMDQNIPNPEQLNNVEEIKLNQELKQEDFIYRVQIAACRKEMGPKDLFQRYKGGGVIEHLFVEGWHKYTIGGFKTFDEAALYRDKCGVDDAFVVLFKGGYRLGIARKTGGVK